MPWRPHVVPIVFAVMHAGGSLVAVAGGLIAAVLTNDPGSAQGFAAIVIAICGLVAAVSPHWFKDRSEQRAERARTMDARVADLAAKQEAAERDKEQYRARVEADEAEKARLRAKVEELEKSRVSANATAIASQAGRLDAAYMTLIDKGIIVPPREDGNRDGTGWPRMLIVEDDPGVVRSWSFILTRWGYNVSDASTVDAAILKLEQDRPVWVLLDLGLAGGDDGLAVLRYVRDNDLPSRVVVMTGSADAEQLAQARALKPEGLFVKPIEPEKVAALRVLIRPRAGPGASGILPAPADPAAPPEVPAP
jgi:CheY-like chemotaxis protein/Spy/CpxP family protein refolding chaperone